MATNKPININGSIEKRSVKVSNEQQSQSIKQMVNNIKAQNNNKNNNSK